MITRLESIRKSILVRAMILMSLYNSYLMSPSTLLVRFGALRFYERSISGLQRLSQGPIGYNSTRAI